MKKGIKQAGVATLAVIASTGIARAADAPSVEELDQRIKVLERQLELQAEDAATKAKDATTASASDKGFSLKKGDYELKIKGLVQADLRYFLDDFNPTRKAAPVESDRFNDTILFRRIRPTFEGSLGKLVGFRLTPEFAGDSATIVDAYLDAKFDPAYTLRVGKVKGPVALERLQSGGSTNFIERGFPTELAPNRDLGVQLQGDLFNSTLNYTLGYYNGTADGRDATSSDGDSRKEIGARLFAEPFKNSPGILQGLGFGIGSTFGSKEQGEANSGVAATTNNFLPRYRTPGQNVFFQYNTARAAAAAAIGHTGIYADGDHVRISPQVYWYYNNLGLIAEYIRSEQEVSAGVLAAGAAASTRATSTVTESFTNDAWQVSASWVITGEDASFRGVAKPKNAYTPGGPGWGAFELAARYGELDIDDDVFNAIPGTAGGAANSFANPNSAASEAKSYGVGVNWYLTSNLKTQLNYTNTSFEGGAAGGQDREDEKTIFARFQVAF
ncbi:porin [Solimonas fluminis]|uniref:Porin n=1 Tax=Solimonas fluminis TaxID=2086571 RepID=A0A2S5TKA4_9GAMM|nr:porin [Solimonas fluminis]PPE75404.1 porin [Solimonas fluminis]